MLGGVSNGDMNRKFRMVIINGETVNNNNNYIFREDQFYNVLITEAYHLKKKFLYLIFFF